MIEDFELILEVALTEPNQRLHALTTKIPEEHIPTQRSPLLTKRETALVLPRNETERALVEIWQEVLGIAQVSIDDNFFELGGNSLQGIRMVVRAKASGLLFTPQQFLQNQTPAELAAAIRAAPALQAEQGIVTGPLTLSPPQTWFFKTFKAISPKLLSNVTCVEVHQPLDPDLLRTALRHLLIHHDGLRTQFILTDQGFQATILHPDQVTPFFDVHDFSATPPEEHHDCTTQLALEMQAGFDFSRPPLLKVAYLNFGPQTPARILMGSITSLWMAFH